MGKDSEKNLVGQPIFNQILKIIPREVFYCIVLELKSNNDSELNGKRAKSERNRRRLKTFE